MGLARLEQERHTDLLARRVSVVAVARVASLLVVSPACLGLPGLDRLTCALEQLACARSIEADKALAQAGAVCFAVVWVAQDRIGLGDAPIDRLERRVEHWIDLPVSVG